MNEIGNVYCEKSTGRLFKLNKYDISTRKGMYSAISDPTDLYVISDNDLFLNYEIFTIVGDNDLVLPRGICPVIKSESETKPDQKSCFHDWHDVTLFTSTVTECKKCGLVQ